MLLRTFYNVEILFENVTTYDEFQREIVEGYAKNYDKLAGTPGNDALSELKNLSIYNKYKVTKKDLLALIRAIEEINEIATYLFALDNSREDFINFGKHFHNLEEFLKQRELALANEQERALITALQLRLDKIKPERSTFSGTFRDLKEGLYYYLKQKNDEDQGVDWIVKNYEQIDGDILQSKRQFEREQHKVYHFACVSDRDMNMTVNDQLPWPLTDEFIRAAYSPIDLQFQVYYTALGERSNFLRYALFYGLCYNRCDARLSYVKQYGDETTEPYALLTILGLKPKAELLESVNKPAPFSISVGQELTKGIKYDRFQMMDMFLCPYRFFLDYVMENGPVVQGNFLYQKYFENLLIEAVWKRIGKQNRSDAMKYLPKILEQEAQKLEPFFKFWKATEIFDLKARARNYLVHEVITNGSGLFVKPYDSEHMKMRKHFGAALFAVDVSEVERKNPYQEFEALVRRDGWNKIYSLHRLPLPGNQEKADILRNETKLYLNQACRKDKTAIPSDWCIYCVHRENCMESFLCSEVGMSSSRNEPCINRSVRANAPVKNTLPPVCEQEIIDVEAVPAEPIIPATASILEQMEQDKIILIRGNHEDLFVELVTTDAGMPYSYHKSNGTYDTALQLTGFDPVMASIRHYDFADAAKDTPFYKEIIPAMLDYFETEHYVFTHGWIPSIPNRDKSYNYISSWREADREQWNQARWFNGMDAAQTADENKTIVCGHWHTSYGHSKYEHKGSEFGEDADFSPYYGPGIIAIDACTAFSGKVNCLAIED